MLIHNLALVLAHHPDKRANNKLEEALHCCEQAEKFADFPFPYPTQLAVTLRQRLQSLSTGPESLDMILDRLIRHSMLGGSALVFIDSPECPLRVDSSC